MYNRISREILDKIARGEINNKKKLDYFKRELSKKYGFKDMLPNSKILEYATESEKEKISLLTRKPVRTISGVSVIAVMCSPHKCPGNCIYCPTGDAPKSYTGKEPAARRAARFNYDPYLQTKNRIKQLNAIGHPTDKIELIIMGGTFLSLSQKYRENFVKKCFDAMNSTDSENLEKSQKLNESAKNRCISLTIETRPDYCKKEHIDKMLRLGTTKVELGVQTLSPKILEMVKRGHTIEDTIKATELLKENCFKVAYHMMPNLFSTPKEDFEMFKELFNNSDFKPDMLKIYPTLVIKGTELYELWKKGDYTPMNTQEMAEHVAKLKSLVPKWVRILRIQRDIPAGSIDAGVTASNLRELIHLEMKNNNKKCICIRCREIGHKIYKQRTKINPENIKLVSEEYEASNGTEIFLSYEDPTTDTLIGFVRLRINNGNAFRKEITEKTALIRELHVYGTEVPLGKHEMGKWQHKGYGKKLLKEAERIAKDRFDKKEMIINSGVGVRKYYSKQGYKLVGPYMMKKL